MLSSIITHATTEASFYFLPLVCRSKAINACVTKCCVSTDQAIEALSHFPPHTKLKKVTLGVGENASVEAVTRQACSLSAVRDRLRDVDTIRIVNVSL